MDSTSRVDGDAISVARFVSRYRQAHEPLHGPLGSEHAIDRERVAAAERTLSVTLPPVLRAFYDLAGAHPVNTASNVLASPEELALAGDGALLFYDEAECTVAWAIRRERLGDEDPEVVQSGDPAVVAPTWLTDTERLSDFLVKQLYWQSVNGGLPIRTRVPEDAAVRARLRDRWQCIEIDRGALIFTRGGCVVSSFRGRPMLVGARTREDLAAFESIARQ